MTKCLLDENWVILIVERGNGLIDEKGWKKYRKLSLTRYGSILPSLMEKHMTVYYTPSFLTLYITVWNTDNVKIVGHLN